jgi:hypothetical protein
MDTIATMLGETISRIDGKKGEEEMIFHAISGKRFVFYHQRSCCESVTIEDISGDLSDLIGCPIAQAEVVSSPAQTDDCNYNYDGYHSSHTWTFYKFATQKGYVTVRWLGESNGYYSEEVDFRVDSDEA